MAKWLKLTATGNGQAAYVNIDNASTVKAIKGAGTRIAFPGGDEDMIDVKETPEEIFTMKALPSA